MNFGAENDFYLFRTDEEGEPTDIPFDSAGFLDEAPEDRGEDVRRDICLTLEAMGKPFVILPLYKEVKANSAFLSSVQKLSSDKSVNG